MILYLLLSVLLLYLIFGHDVPACRSRVSYYIVVHVYCLFSWLFVISVIPVLSLYGDEVSELYTDIYIYIYIYMYLRRMGLAGRFGNGVLICICCWFHISRA